MNHESLLVNSKPEIKTIYLKNPTNHLGVFYHSLGSCLKGLIRIQVRLFEISAKIFPISLMYILMQDLDRFVVNSWSVFGKNFQES